MKVVALAGGVGGARLVDGLAQLLPGEDLTVVVNTGDDFEHLGLTICPDLDTVCYTLAGLANPETGWGQARETWNALDSLACLGGPTWFRVGDKDLGTHLERTRRIRAGQCLSQVTRHFCRSWGIHLTVLPMSNDPVRTRVYTEEGELAFQEYFVRRKCGPRVVGFLFEGIEHARPAPGVLSALNKTDLVVICPSNPWVSVGPILALPGIREILSSKTVVAISPIIGGKAVKGPAAKMYQEMGIAPSALAVARHYGSLLAGFVLDTSDSALAGMISDLGIRTWATDILMRDRADRRRLAEEVIHFSEQLHLSRLEVIG